MAGALSVVVSQPSLWVLGALAFALRGGVVLLLASIVVLPTPVEIRMLLGTNLGSTGLAPGFVALLGVAAVIGVIALLTILAVLASLELASFERVVTHPDTDEQRRGRLPRRLAPGERRLVVGGLFAVQLLALAVLIVAAIPLANAVIAVAYQEIVRPSLGGTIYTRVLGGVREPLFLLIAALVLVEMLSSLAGRRLLVRAYGLATVPPPRGILGTMAAVPLAIGAAIMRPLRRPGSTLATLVAVWLSSVAVLAPLAWGLSAVWQSVRGVFLGPAAGTSDADAMAELAIVTLALAAMWTMAMLVSGFVSALRAAMWSTDGLR